MAQSIQSSSKVVLRFILRTSGASAGSVGYGPKQCGENKSARKDA